MARKTDTKKQIGQRPFLNDLKILAENHFNKDFDQLTPPQRSKAMGVLYMTRRLVLENVDFGSEEEDLIEEMFIENVVDGASDQGIDLIYTDDSEEDGVKKHYIIQCKYSSNKNKIEDKHEVSSFTQTPKVLHPILGKDSKKNKYLSNRLDSFDWNTDLFEFIYITLNKKNKDIGLIENKGIDNFDHDHLSDLSSRSTLSILDSEDLNKFTRAYHNIDMRSGNEIEINLIKSNNPYITYETEGKKSYIGLISANQLCHMEEYYAYDNILNLNIRHHLGNNTSINKEIVNSAKTEPENFFFYNNGISAMAKEVEVSEDKPNVLKCKNFSIINGGQTFKSLAKAYKENRYEEPSPDDIEVMIRITEYNYYKDQAFTDKITEFNNTQNVVKASDFRSNDSSQLSIKKFLEARKSINGKPILYLNKRDTKSSKYFNIGLEEYCKHVFSFIEGPIDRFGTPHLFDTNKEKGGYSKIFPVDKNDGPQGLETKKNQEYAAIVFIGHFLKKKLSVLKKQENWINISQNERENESRYQPNISQVLHISRLLFSNLLNTEISEEICEYFIQKKIHEGQWVDDKDNNQYENYHIFFNSLLESAARIYSVNYAQKINLEEEGFIHRNYLRSEQLIKDLEKTLNVFILGVNPDFIPSLKKKWSDI